MHVLMPKCRKKLMLQQHYQLLGYSLSQLDVKNDSGKASKHLLLHHSNYVPVMCKDVLLI